KGCAGRPAAAEGELASYRREGDDGRDTSRVENLPTGEPLTGPWPWRSESRTPSTKGGWTCSWSKCCSGFTSAWCCNRVSNNCRRPDNACTSPDSDCYSLR